MTLFDEAPTPAAPRGEPSGEAEKRSADPAPETVEHDNPADLSGPLVRVRLLVAYDGAGFHGFAEQVNVRTVAGVLREAIEKVVRVPVELTCAGRTDAGVHAWGQVVSLDVPAGTDLDRLQRSLVALCGPQVVVREVAVAAPDFDARFSARARTYRYSVLNAPVPDPFTAQVTWHVPAPLAIELLRLACDPFLGEHDFAAFCRRPKVPEGDEPVSLVRRVRRAAWEDLGEGRLRLEITADAFCHQMVRSIVGTMVAAGHGNLRAGDIRGILAKGDRVAAAPIAPPHGLCLWHVAYQRTRRRSCGMPEISPSFALRSWRLRAWRAPVQDI